MTKKKFANKSISPTPKQTPDADRQLRDEAKAFVLQYGLLTLMDVFQGTVNKILVQKGIVTREELRDAYMRDLKKAAALEFNARCQAVKKR